MGLSSFGGVVVSGCLLVVRKHRNSTPDMDHLCNQTGENFQVCMNCLQGNESSSSRLENNVRDGDGMRKIGGDLINCTLRFVKKSLEFVREFEGNHTGDQRYAARYCEFILDEVEDNFDSASRFWSNSRDWLTMEFIDFGGEHYRNCRFQIPKDFPAEFISQLNGVEARIDVAAKAISVIVPPYSIYSSHE